GGHIAPALALAEALRQIEPECTITCICGTKELERSMYHAADFDPFLIEGRAAQGKNPLNWMRAAWAALAATRRARRILKERQCQVVVGMGGYVAAPVLMAARTLGLPIYLHEQNAIPGRSNKFLSRLATFVTAAHHSALDLMRGDQQGRMGNPVAPSFLRATREDGIARFGLDEERPGIFVMGGSQGAVGLNDRVFEA